MMHGSTKLKFNLHCLICSRFRPESLRRVSNSQVRTSFVDVTRSSRMIMWRETASFTQQNA